MSFKEELLNFKNQFDSKLSIFLDTKINETKKYNPVIEQNLKHIAYITQAGGKRFRPAMAYFGYSLISQKTNENIWLLCLALELFHVFALIHDDIIDKSLVRRGVPTVEAIYLDYFKIDFPSLDHKHFAASAAILSGDFVLVLANQLVISLNQKENTNTFETQQLFEQMQIELVAGQEDDCFGVGLADLDDLNVDRIKAMLIAKSGNYSIQKPLLMGAILAGADQVQLDILASSGEKLGLVFQIKDDILGIFGSEADIGKSNTSDIKEGKKTLLVAKTYQTLTDIEKAKFKTILGNEIASISEISWFKEIILKSGAVSQLEEYCLELVTEAKEELNSLESVDKQALQFLLDLADYLYNRKS